MSIYNTAQPVLYYIPVNNHHKTMHHQHHHSNHAQHHHNVYTQIEQQHAAMNAMSQRKHVLPSFNNLLNNIYQIDYNYNYTHIQQPHPIASASSPASRNNSFDNYTYTTATTNNNNIPHHHNNSIGSITPPVQHNIPQYIHTPPVQNNNTGQPINTPPASITNIDSTSNSNIITPRSCKIGKPGQAGKPGKGAAKQKRKRKNYVKKRTNSIKDIITSATPTKKCFQCQEANTPEWRLGPYGNRSLCNACGLYYRRLIQRFDLKQANLIMRFNKFVKPVNNMRQIPNQIDIPNNIIKQLDDDPHLDSNYNNID